MSVEWASDDFRREVPTLRNSILVGQTAAIAHGWAVACPGTSRPGAVTAPPARISDVFAAARPSALTAVMAAAHPTPFENYQDKTRISAAGGGVSGSPPAWDPV
jgi:hypothetical protein